MAPSDLHSTGKFQYEPLRPADASIRVLQVCAGRNDEQLQCLMRHISLEEEYVCLSYTWGTDAATHPVIINNQVFLVRDSLWAFLLQARTMNKFQCMPIWIDAITINQDDIEEKNVQVALMGDIYEQAQEVVVWLGEGDEMVEKAFKFVNQYANTGDLSVEPMSESDIMPVLLANNQGIKRYWDAFDTLSALVYFSRMWIVQEFLLAKSLTLRYGENVMPLNTLLNLCLFIEQSKGPPGAAEDIGDLKINQSPCGALVKQRFYSLFGLNRSYGVNRIALNFPLLFRRFRHQGCFDARDKVYALRAMDPKMKDFPVDYAASPILLLPQIYEYSQSWDVSTGWSILRTLGLSHDEVFSETKDCFPGKTWKTSINDVGVLGPKGMACSRRQVDWEEFTLPNGDLGEYCQYIEEVEFQSDSDECNVVREGDILLRPGWLNMFLVVRGPSEDTIALLDEIHSNTTDGDYASNQNITALNEILSTFTIVGALPIHPDHTSRLAIAREEDVGSERDGEPLLLTLTKEMDDFVEGLKGVIFRAHRLDFTLSLTWQHLLAFWRVLDKPGLLRENMVANRKKIENWSFYCN
ncbi:heterokaryon incompatibility protein-domain-containing protein [Venturia nashicola]|uniref:Heterokaryon incompatibility protein-domain-containing protein n=1 Tax=Venturia nashicola TaxID=86259 RepID=A0A4Z1PWQ3_9PEZI|nr:heterokaryon incompatibility protein-domain-containing protein [Venturia nashicola]TLD39629.1 heterokaryon incompatibility protein-domain-containing protein [Venturia nashicola]